MWRDGGGRDLYGGRRLCSINIGRVTPTFRAGFKKQSWLVIHVMTITLAYAAFFLALGIGNVGLFYMIKLQNRDSAVIRELVDTCYKSLQVGVVLLAAGTSWVEFGGLFLGSILGLGS